MVEEIKQESERLAKVIARSGLCSRRDAEKLIALGKVKVDGQIITTPATKVNSNNKIVVDGKAIDAAEKTRLWLFYKPRGYLVSAKDPQGRQTIHDILPKDLPRIITVGRLDYNSEGLLLLTNNGKLSRHLELPSTGWKRRYRVRAFGRYNEDSLDKLRKGCKIDGIQYGKAEITVEKSQGANNWFEVTISEGKNREIRKLFEHINLEVNRLIRVAFGPFQIGTLTMSQVKEVPSKVIKEQVGFKAELL